MDTFIIAEAGSNHNKDFDQALKLIDVAKWAGADAVKFQTFFSETVYSKNTPDFAGYKNINKLIKDIELPREWQKDLKQYCDEIDIEFMSTPFDEQAVDELVNLGVKRLKISGFEATDPRFVEMVASTKLPIIMSVGIGFKWNYWGLYKNIFKKYNNDVTLLHCNNAYPTPPEDTFLDTIKTISLNTGYKTGFSDHSMSPYTPSLAVAVGATVIEKHFTLNRDLKGPDHSFSLEPNELKIMVEQIRYAKKCKGHKTDFSSSEENFKTAMRSVVAKDFIKRGDLFTKDNLTTKRPFIQGNIAALKWNNILGKTADKDYNIDDFIK